MSEKLHALEQYLERKVSKEQSLIVRLFLTPALFFVFLVHAVVYSVSILFFPQKKSYKHVHNMSIDDAKKEHVDSHRQWAKKLRVGSLATLVLSVTITSVIVSAFAGKLPTLAAGDCSLDIQIEPSPINVDSYIGTQSGCSNLTVTTTGATTEATLQFTDSEVDVASGGTITIDSGVTIVFSGALNYPTGGVVNDGTITHAAEDTTGVTITAETIENNGTINANGKGCQYIAATSTSAYGAAPNSSGVCTQGEVGSGRGSDSNVGAGGAGHGSYGGRGNARTREAGIYYGDVLEPSLLGASGGSAANISYGGNGGGRVFLTAINEIENNGAIAVNGEDGVYEGNRAGGGGAGGSIFLTAPVIQEVGEMTANGGNGGTAGTATAIDSSGGGGAGGRIALRYTDSINSPDSSNFSLTAGLKGGGTKSQDAKPGTAVVIDETNASYDIFSGFTWDQDFGTVDSPVSSMTIDTEAQMYCDEDVASITIVANDVEWAGSLDCDNSDIEDGSSDNSDTAKLAKRLALFSLTANNSLDFSSGTNIDFSDEEMVFELQSPNNLTFDNVTISGAQEGLWKINDDIDITLENNTTINSNIYWFIDNLNVSSDSTLNADGKGCRATRMDTVNATNDLIVQENSFGPNSENICVDPADGDGVGGVEWYRIAEKYNQIGTDGAGHGGVGGAGSQGAGFQGEEYGNEARPTLFGSAGGSSGSSVSGSDRLAQGGHGGGLVLVQASNSMQLDGRVSANGNDGETANLIITVDPEAASGGGSGGTVRLVTDECTSTGLTLSVNGGKGATDGKSQGGGGAGGRARLAALDGENCIDAFDDEVAAPGAAGASPATDGGQGTGDSSELTTPNVAITFPYPNSYNVDVNPTITTTPYSDNGGFKMSHSVTVKEKDGGTVWETGEIETTDEGGLSIAVNESNGTFADGKTALDKETEYCVTVEYTNLAGAGSDENCFQTVYLDETLNAQVLYEWTFSDATDYIFDTTFVEFVSDIVQLLDIDGSEAVAYSTGTYADVVVNAQALRTKADFWYTISETLAADNAGSVRYQIGNDADGDGSVDAWYYVDYSAFSGGDYTAIPTWTEVSSDPSESNTTSAEDLNYYAPAWTIAAEKSGYITIRGYLLSDGSNKTALDTTAVIVSNNDRDGDGYDDVDAGGDDCNDDDPSVNPGAEEVWYDGIDQNCDGLNDYDQDSDGYVPDEHAGTTDLPGGDCNDTDPTINPGASETYYDGIDQNCDGLNDYDQDSDGYVPDEHAGKTDLDGGDCNDLDASVYPGAPETYYDGVDQNCDGASDYDADKDGYDSDSFGGDDCDDTDAGVNPGAAENYYDGVDQNCDGESDFDADEDGYDSDSFGGDDCDDSDLDVNPGADDALVDGVDLDCDGQDGPDEDGDGFGPEDAGGNDCNDADSTIFPGAEEINDDGIDQDCDGVDGEGQDNDGDGFAGEEIGGSDCDDGNPLVFPASPDGTRNALDENCDGVDGPFIVDRVTGTERGAGIVTVYAPDGSIHYTYEAFPNRGVYPVLLEYQNRYFVASVHWGFGRYLNIHELRAPDLGAEELVVKRQISRTGKRRRMDFDLLGKKQTPHVVLSTIRGNVRTGQKRRLKILSFKPERTQSLRYIRSTSYRVRQARKKIGNTINIVDNSIIVIKLKEKGKFRTVFMWNPKVK